MVIDAPHLAAELRRRRTVRRELADRVEQSSGTTWVPDNLKRAPTELLVLAAMNLTSRPSLGR